MKPSNKRTIVRLWRKYENGVEATVSPGASVTFSGYALWPVALEEALSLRLPSWAGLEPAFSGLVSHGFGKPVALAYDVGKTSEIIAGRYLGKTWIGGADAAAVYEFLLHDLGGVWMGRHTPFLVSDSATLLDGVKF